VKKITLLFVIICFNLQLTSALTPTGSVKTITRNIKINSNGQLIPVPEKPSAFKLFKKNKQPLPVSVKKTTPAVITEQKVSASVIIKNTNIAKKIVLPSKLVQPKKPDKKLTETIKIKSEIMKELNEDKPAAVRTVQPSMKYEACAVLSLPSLLNFNSNSTIASVGSTSYLLGCQLNIYYPLMNNLYAGILLGAGQNNIARKVSTGVYTDVNVHYLISNLIINWVIISDTSFSLETYAGIGLISGGYVYSYTDETQATFSFSKLRDGFALNTQLGANLRLKINPNWDVGFGAAYMLGKVTDLRRAGEPDPTSPELDFSGLMLKLNSSISF